MFILLLISSQCTHKSYIGHKHVLYTSDQENEQGGVGGLGTLPGKI